MSFVSRVKYRGRRKTPLEPMLSDSPEESDVPKPILTVETLRRLARIVEAIKQRSSEAASQSLAAESSGGQEPPAENPCGPSGQDPSQQDGTDE